MVTFQHVSPSHIPTFFTAQHFYIFSLDFKIVCLDFTIQHPYISHSYAFLLFLLSTISTFFIVRFHSLDFTIVLFFPCLTFLHFSPSNIPTFFHSPTFLTVQNFLILSVQQSYISFFLFLVIIYFSLLNISTLLTVHQITTFHCHYLQKQITILLLW